MLEKILNRRNIERALKAVERNKGAGGVDGLQSDELRPFLNSHLRCLSDKILDGKYEPSPVRKVEIPKPSGGTRMLGIPTVTDRMIQQAIYQQLSPIYESEFSEYSFGFRPAKNAHQAVKTAQEYLNAGYIWIIELDLEKFFDKVNHQKLMHLLSAKVKDVKTRSLIRSYLRSGVMEGGFTSVRTEGTPQGSPLSPLLSNIMLHELDKELAKRGHKFVRFADDCSIYVKSERAAQRVVQSLIKYIENELHLKVNREKTKISEPRESYLLGFSFYQYNQRYQVRIHQKPVQRVKAKCRHLTRSSDPTPEYVTLAKLANVIRGWVNYFSLANAKKIMVTLDGMLYTRLRISAWRRWKVARNRIVQLQKLGASAHKAYMWGHSSKGPCRIAHSPVLTQTLTHRYYSRVGHQGFFQSYVQRHDDAPFTF